MADEPKESIGGWRAPPTYPCEACGHPRAQGSNCAKCRAWASNAQLIRERDDEVRELFERRGEGGKRW